MTADLDVSAIQTSTGGEIPRTRRKPGGDPPGDLYLDVTDEAVIVQAVPRVPRSSRWLTPRDRLSLSIVLLVLCSLCLASQAFKGSADSQPPPLPAYRVDLNTAGLEELVLLEGIGELTADRILLDRETNGPFVRADDLQRVKGIGPRTLERLREQVVCR